MGPGLRRRQGAPTWEVAGYLNEPASLRCVGQGRRFPLFPGLCSAPGSSLWPGLTKGMALLGPLSLLLAQQMS